MPMIFAANVAEDDLATGNKYVDLVKDYAEKNGSEVVIVSKHKVEASELQKKWMMKVKRIFRSLRELKLDFIDL